MMRRKIDHRIWKYKHRAWHWAYLQLRAAQHFSWRRVERYSTLKIGLRRER